MIESIRWLSFLTLCIIIPSLIANRDFQLYRTICISKFDIELSQQNEQNILNKLTKELPIFLKERKIYIVSVSDPSNQSLNTTSCDIYLNFTIALDPIYQIENSTSQSLLTYKESINLCPHRELFSFTPILHLPTSWLTDISDSYSDNNQLLTFFRNTLCSGAPNSITGPNFIPTNSTKSSSTSNTADLQLTVLEVGVSFILRQRYERSLWREVFTPSELLALDHIGLFDYRQFVPGGVVIWIGSESKLDLIRSQIISIQYKDTTVIPWAATELIYPCRKGSTQCHGNNNKYKFIPKSDVNHMPPGWGCAQRRPLRALSHILALYDPLYVVILDDDTLFNFPLFLDKYSSFLRNEMLHAPIVLGEFVGKIGNNGHLSKIGMMAGGSGYILGKAVLDRLVAAELIESITSVSQEQYDQRFHFDSSTTSSSNSSRSNSYSDINGQIETLAISSAVEGWNDIYRSVDHINYLSIAKEFKKLSSLSSPYMNMTNTRHSHTRIGFTYTTEGKDTLIPRVETSFNLSIRLIDLCVSLMAREHTCLHSDHSMTRCLLYGAWATPVSVVCHSFIDSPNPSIDSFVDIYNKKVRTGMCFSTPFCNLSTDITCHRYKASYIHSKSVYIHSVSNISRFKAVRIDGYQKHSFKYSSGFDGNITDTF